MKSWFSGIKKAFLLCALISILISDFTTGKVSYGSQISAYCSLSLGVIMILLMIIESLFKNNQSSPTSELVSSVIMNAGPIMIMLGTLGFLLYLTIKYKDLIIDGNISSNYETFKLIYLLLLKIQIYLLYTNIGSDAFILTGKLPKFVASLLYLIGVISMICTLIIFVILAYYTTDG